MEAERLANSGVFPLPDRQAGDVKGKVHLATDPATDDSASLRDAPDGIGRRHLSPSGAWLRGLFPLGLLGALLLAALLGVFGGTRDPTVTTRANGVLLSVDAPRTIRSGMILEIDIEVASTRPIAKPVVTISGSYLNNLSFNTIIPEASRASFANGAVGLQYDALKAGDRLEVKLDGQVNPPLAGENDGKIAILDDKTVLAERPVRLRVFP